MTNFKLTVKSEEGKLVGFVDCVRLERDSDQEYLCWVHPSLGIYIYELFKSLKILPKVEYKNNFLLISKSCAL